MFPKRGGVPTEINDSVQSGNWQALTENLDLKSRAVVYRQAIRQGREITDWPTTPEALVRAFWDAASKKQYERMALYCPGSLASDYKKYFDQWTPSPVKEFGAAPHPGPQLRRAPDEGVRFYYARVAFPFFPNKTVKMAVPPPLEGSQLSIDGQKTVWW